MSWQVAWLPEAARESDHLPAVTRERIYSALARLAIEERGDVKRLRGELQDQYRLRVGEYRVRFRFEQAAARLIIVAVSARSGAYKE